MVNHNLAFLFHQRESHIIVIFGVVFPYVSINSLVRGAGLVDFQNVERPITLLGMGRSGTTVISEAFKHRSDFEDLNETGGLIFGVWQSAESTFVPLKAQVWKSFKNNPDAKNAHFVRTCICSLSSLNTPHWFHKPAGLPFSHLDLSNVQGKRTKHGDIPIDWYWTVLTKSFPQSKYIMPVRNPFDVAISRHRHSGWPLESVITLYARNVELLTERLDIFSTIIKFEELHNNFAETMEKLCYDLKLEFDPAMLNAKDNYAAPLAKATGPTKTYKDQWSVFDGMPVNEAELSSIKDFFEKIGFELQIPSGLKMK